MRIVNYSYIKGTEPRDGYIAIPELDRSKSAVRQFIKLANLDIRLTRPTAFIYVDGFAVSQAESGLSHVRGDLYRPTIQYGSSFAAHEWIYTFKRKNHLRHVDIISSTCAAGVQAIYEAQRLLDDRVVEEVIIIGAERITPATLLLFKELRIPVTCGDGFAYMRLENAEPGLEGTFEIYHPRWKYAFNKNPFKFEKFSLNTLRPGYHLDYVKLHGTGTESNTEAESGLAELATPLIYKDTIGHTQGVSALLETCIVLDDPEILGRILVTANGLGGFYGAYTLLKC